MPKNPFTFADLEKLGFYLQPDGSYSRCKRATFPATNPIKENETNQSAIPPLATPPATRNPHPYIARIHNPKPQRHARQPLVDCPKAKKSSKSRITLSIVRHATRTLDPDNLEGGCKYLIDELRYANLIPDDDPTSISLITTQAKCRKGEEKTVVELVYS